MYCKHCGKEIDDNSTFCKYCGKNQSKDDNDGMSLVNVQKTLDWIKRTIDSFPHYDWSEAVKRTKERFPTADAIKYRVCFITNTFDYRKNYNDFYCFDNEKDMKESVINYLKGIQNDPLGIITNDYRLDVYISTDAFISKDHDKNEPLFNIDDNSYIDADKNIWVSCNCQCLLFECGYTIESDWPQSLGQKPINNIPDFSGEWIDQTKKYL